MLYYLSSYSGELHRIGRPAITALATDNKIDYIRQLLRLSNVDFTDVAHGFVRRRGLYGPRFGRRSAVMPCLRLISRDSLSPISLLFEQQFLLAYLCAQLSRGDTLLVYHYPWLHPTLRAAKRIRGFRLLLQLEEIHHTNSHKSALKGELWRGMERGLIDLADGFVLSSRPMQEYLRQRGAGAKPALVCHGNYGLAVEETSERRPRTPDQPFEIFFSGTLSQSKGAHEAIELAARLPSDCYRVFIAGYGTERDTAALVSRVAEARLDHLTYLGQLSRRAYLEHLASADLCLCCQYDRDEFARYSFPSKVIDYLAFDRAVICTDSADPRRAGSGSRSCTASSSPRSVLLSPAEAAARPRSTAHIR